MLRVYSEAPVPLRDPVYLDTNIIVGGLVRRHSLFSAAAAVIADVMMYRSRLVLSDMVTHESYWALLAEAFAMSQGQRSGALRMTAGIFRRHSEALFGDYAGTISVADQWVSGLVSAGHPVDVVCSPSDVWARQSQRSYTFMREFGLLPADAVHLSLAEAHAKTFVTADRGFRSVAGANAPTDLDILEVSV